MAIICFGEVLWDCLPAGLFLGGAPYNVAAHLVQLGRSAVPVSALGNDQLGREVRRRMRLQEIDDCLVAEVHAPTGTVLVELQDGQPSYAIVDDVAWDAIPWTEELAVAAAAAPACIYGSLAQRHSGNRVTLQKTLDACSGRHIFDVNLRPPWVDRSLVDELAGRSDLIKLNDGELRLLLDAAADAELADLAAALSQRHGAVDVCVTAGAQGAGWMRGGHWHWCDAPQVQVRDAVGAGDSFLAALIDGILSERDADAILQSCVRLAAHVAASDGATPAHPA